MSEKLTCPICGEPTRIYMGNARKDRLCGTHADMLKSGKIQTNEQGLFVDSKTNKILNANYIEPSERYTELPQEGFDKCLTCGKETGGYAFCRKCYYKYTLDEMLNFLNNPQLIEQYTTTESDVSHKNDSHSEQTERTETMTQSNDSETPNSVVIIKQNGRSRCITCGKFTEGFLFCEQCYAKYKNKQLLFRIENCSSIELLDADYEGRFKCLDGHIVKSKSEREIDDYLFRNGIPHVYEQELPYGAGNQEILHPDFCLLDYLGPKKHVYLEHWGYNKNNIHYTKTKKFKMPIYERLGITLVCTHEQSDTKDINAVLDRKLNKAFIQEGKINFDN